MDNLLKVVSQLNNKMSTYLLNELEKEGFHNFALSHGNILVNFKDKEEMNYRELSKRINKSPQTMTTLIRKLEKEGYISLKVDSSDKRNKLVRLTDEGKKFIPILFDISKKLFQKQYQNISEQDQIQLRTLLFKVMDNFEE